MPSNQINVPETLNYKSVKGVVSTRALSDLSKKLGYEVQIINGESTYHVQVWREYFISIC